jgi:purine catabolism regulator
MQRPTTVPLTVAAALRETALSEAQLVAGASSLDRLVEGVAVLDVADLDAVLPHQLVLVSAYALLETPLERLVRELARRRASALGVKLDPYWSEMPEELVAAAEAAALPLIALPQGRFEDLVNPLLSAIVERQASVLRSIADFERALTRAALQDSAWDSPTAILGDALAAEVATFDEDGELLAAARGGSAWAERLAGPANAAVVTCAVECGGESYLVAPISAKGRRYGTVCVRGVDAGDTVARAAVAEAAVVTGMQILGRRHVEAVHRRFERELLDDLVAGRLSEREARERAERVGWPVRRPYLVLYVTPRTATGRNGSELRVGDEHLPALDRALRSHFSARSFRYRGGLAIVVHFARTEEPRAVADAVAARLETIRAVPWEPATALVGASAPARDIARIPDAARQARLTVALAPPRDGRRVAHFSELGAARLLVGIDDPERILDLARAELGALADAQAPGSAELLDTLGSLLGSNMKVGKAADELFFHYNTVRHRLARLRDLFGDRLAGEEGQVALWLAVMALRIAELDRPVAPDAQRVALPH